MGHITKIEVTPGISWIEIPEADLRVLCGCPADSVKHLARRALIRPTEVGGVACESGPNAILLSDVMVQNGVFCNMAEFPVLQMLYRQGMLLPNHPNNKGVKPLLIGRHDAVELQMQYIYRGNYGLISEEEIRATGVPPEQARAMMRLKLRFAFGRIQHPREMLDALVLNESARDVEIRGGATVRRVAHNVFEFGFRGERERVDLNLAPFEVYECPYQLGAYHFQREYFAVVHSGEGDGWDMRRPTMGAVLVYQGRIYLIDAGPNLPHTLAALGIGVNEIEGIFHTHCHDDHFAGLPALIQGDRRIKHFATPAVHASISKKLAALLGFEDRDFHEYFEVVDLRPEEWNDIDGLEVRPVPSPHPVETTVLFFRTVAAGGWRTYAHLADIAALKTLDAMVTDDPAKPGLDRAGFEHVRQSYLEPADVKKVDIGGGMIHGDAEDFRNDPSGKIILAHTAFKLTETQKQIGSGGSFGTVDVLVPTQRDFTARSAFYHLTRYFPNVPRDYLASLLNSPIRTFNPETILLKEGQDHDSIFLLLTGQVEMMHAETAFRSVLTSGALLGEISGLHGLPSLETYRALTFVQALDLPRDLYVRFVQRHDLFAEISHLMKGRDFLRRTWLFSGIMSTAALNAIAKAMTTQKLATGASCNDQAHAVGVVKSGRLRRTLAGEELEVLGPGDFFGEEEAVFGAPAFTSVTATEPSEILLIPVTLVRSIPNVRWKLFENFERRTSLEVASASTTRRLLEWHEDYRVNVQAIDKQHRRLLAIANKLLVNVEADKGQEIVAETLDHLLAYTLYHFTEEEQLLQRYGYAEAADHAARHKKLMGQLGEFVAKVQDGGISAEDLLEFVHKWVVNHILIEDRKFGPFLNEKGVY